MAVASNEPDTRETDDTDWGVCPGCGEPIYGKRLARNLHACPDCGHHHRLTAPARVGQLLDDTPLELVDLPVRSVDLLGFSDTVPYPARLEHARATTGLDEGVVVARGAIDGQAVVAVVMDFRFLGGSLGAAVGELVTRAAELALRDRIPLLIVSASGGARMQEGAVSLMQMAKTSQALARLDEAGVLTISLVTDPTYGGVAASFSTLCDVILAEPGARLGFAGPRVIQQTIGRELPPGFQTAEFLYARGLIDGIVPRQDQRVTLGRLLSAGGSPAPRPGTIARPLAGRGVEVVVRDPDELAEGDPWTAVLTARDTARPTTQTYVGHVFDDFVELHGDRLGGNCSAIVGGPAELDGRAVMVIGHEKGNTVAELRARNFGMATPQGYRKAVRLMQLAAKLRLPLVTLVDTAGAYPGIEAEEHGQALAIADSIRVMSRLPVPVVTVVTGEGGSGGALALAVADEVLICSNGVYSVISPEGCAAILWNDRSQARTAAGALRLDARELLRLGIVDGVVLEPDGGAQADHATMAQRLRTAVRDGLDRLTGLDPADLVTRRWARFRAFGNEVVGGPTDRGEARR